MNPAGGACLELSQKHNPRGLLPAEGVGLTFHCCEVTHHGVVLFADCVQLHYLRFGDKLRLLRGTFGEASSCDGCLGRDLR